MKNFITNSNAESLDNRLNELISRIYGDGKHMNSDILDKFPLPLSEEILRYSVLLKK